MHYPYNDRLRELVEVIDHNLVALLLGLGLGLGLGLEEVFVFVRVRVRVVVTSS